MNDTTAAGSPTRCLECENRRNLPGAAGYCKSMTPLTALIAYEVMNRRPGFCPLNSEKPKYLPAGTLPPHCSVCDYCEVTGTTYLCIQMKRRIVLLPHEVHQTRPNFCPLELDYRQAGNIKKPR